MEANMIIYPSVLPQSRPVTAAVTPRYPGKHLPAHDCVRLGVCYWCHAPCKVVRLGVGHITVPWCGCGRIKVDD